MTQYHSDYESVAKNIIQRVGKTIVIGIPLGLGKPIGTINALYNLACKDSNISLTILTALTLSRPPLTRDLEKRLAEPILDRLLGDYENPLYETARLNQSLPQNIKVIEFYFSPGKYLAKNTVQQDYISANYTNVVRDAVNQKINVYAQLVSAADGFSDYSLSSNTDLFHDTIDYLKISEKEGNQIAIVAEVNANLPFMLNDALVKPDVFTDVVDTKEFRALFATPKLRISPEDHLIGLYTSLLIKDGSCLQVGIGKLGEAITNALILRHKQNPDYLELLNKLQIPQRYPDLINQFGATDIFKEGLYASTEMLSDGYMHLYQEQILKKKVYDHLELQKLLNAHLLTEVITPESLDILIEHKVIDAKLTQKDVDFLITFGFFKPEILLDGVDLQLPSGERIPADIVRSKPDIIAKCLGTQLKNGKIIHAGFFLGSHDFYTFLKTLPTEVREQIDMTAVARTNRLCWSHELLSLQRQQARFVNASMMVTLVGTVISDGLADWQEVSGVGGQFDFADMAQNLPGARFIINCHSTRTVNGKVTSNIVWNYPNMTLPRTFRDLIITEYGIADCRSKTDSEIIKAILNVADSRFQDELLRTAKRMGKISETYEIPAPYRNNTPAAVAVKIKLYESSAFFNPYPFGNDLTVEEEAIKQALIFLADSSKIRLIITVVKSFLFLAKDKKYQPYLQRMKLDKPRTIKDLIYKKLLTYLIAHQPIRAV